jgi:hypothetical protein
MIFDLATNLITQRRIDASFVAAARVVERRRLGDCLGERIWTDVLRAIEAMSDEAPIAVQ